MKVLLKGSVLFNKTRVIIIIRDCIDKAFYSIFMLTSIRV